MYNATLNYNYVYTMYIMIKSSDILFIYLFHVSEKEEVHPNELKCRQSLSQDIS